MRRGARVFLSGEFVSPPIGEALADATLERQLGALRIGHKASLVAEVELGTVTGKVRLAHVVIGADHAALEDREEISTVLLCLKPPVVTYYFAP